MDNAHMGRRPALATGPAQPEELPALLEWARKRGLDPSSLREAVESPGAACVVVGRTWSADDAWAAVDEEVVGLARVDLVGEVGVVRWLHAPAGVEAAARLLGGVETIAVDRGVADLYAGPDVPPGAMGDDGWQTVRVADVPGPVVRAVGRVGVRRLRLAVDERLRTACPTAREPRVRAATSAQPPGRACDEGAATEAEANEAPERSPADTIAFRRPGEPNGALSNFSRHGFWLDGYFWPTVEHYFQAFKHVGTPLEHRIRRARGPTGAKRLARDRSGGAYGRTGTGRVSR